MVASLNRPVGERRVEPTPAIRLFAVRMRNVGTPGSNGGSVGGTIEHQVDGSRRATPGRIDCPTDNHQWLAAGNGQIAECEGIRERSKPIETEWCWRLDPFRSSVGEQFRD